MARRGRPPGVPGIYADKEYGPEEELALAAQVARAYYIEDRSKVAIAEEIGLSRFQVARLLQVARTSGVVRIEINNPGAVDRELSALMQQRLGVQRAVVVSSPTSVPLTDIGRTLATLFSETVEEGNTVGLSWSRALRSMVEQLHDVKRCTVVQLAGHMSPQGESIGSVELVRRTAEIAGGEALPIYAPFLVPSAAAASSLVTQPDIARAMADFDRLDLAMISIGSWAPSLSVIYDSMTETERKSARARGVVGDINGRMFDSEGNSVDPDMDGRTIAITFDQLRRTPEVICSSYGAPRAAATLAAIRAEVAKTWVMDQALAQAVLALAEERG
jgi:DNA-binding transcriptional regulator LsrR (DeoR family)